MNNFRGDLTFYNLHPQNANNCPDSYQYPNRPLLLRQTAASSHGYPPVHLKDYTDSVFSVRKEDELKQKLIRSKRMGTGEALKAAKVYRELMKAVKKHIGKEEQKTHFRDYIKSEFRKNGDGLETSFIQQKIRLARDYTYLINSVHHHQDLLFSYNIAVDRSDEMKRILGKSAASVGLQLPDVYQP
ncbi:hypothetical protein L1887_07334 [Cichorium endivia]|nr:hypothetical protein L1887_07334 [Cichorium endivia]